MINYYFERQTQNQPYFLKITFQPEQPILSSYLFQISDKQIYDWIVKGLNKVLSGKSEYVERDTEWYGAKITSQNTIFYVLVDEKDTETNVITTEDFKIVLNAWWNEKNFFEKWKDENYRKLV